MFTGWILLRPWALGLLVFPLLVVLLSMRKRQPASVPLGTARWFAAEGRAEAAKSKRWLSLARVLAILAMLAAALGLASPERQVAQTDARLLVVLLDRTPSMFLPVRPVDAPDGDRRIDAAVRRAEAWIERERERPSIESVTLRVVWNDARAVDPLEGGTASPDPWLQPDAIPSETPIWSAWDREGFSWATDRLPDEDPEFAGVFASGGPLVPGLVAVDADGGWRTSADRAAPLQLDASVAPPSVAVGAEVPEVVREFVGVWASARGLLMGEPSEATVLRIHGASNGASGVPAAVSRDRWSASVQHVPGGEAAGEPWLRTRDGQTAISMAPGAITLHFTSIVPAEGSAAEFAVSWSALLDEARIPPRGVVSSSERASAGAGGSVEPATVATSAFGQANGTDAALREMEAQDAREESRRLRALLSALAAALGVGAVVLRARGSG